MIKNILVVGSGKGGVGKSTVAINLSIALSKKKNTKVGLLDADIYGPSIPQMLGIKSKPKISKSKKILPYEKYGIKSMSIGNMLPKDSAVIWRGVMASNAIRQFLRDIEWGDLDFLVIDLPPGTGDIQLSLCQNLEISGSVLVSTPQEVSLIDVRKAINMFEKVNVPILGLIQNLSYLEVNKEKNYVFGKNGVLDEAKKRNFKILGDIPIISKISVSCDTGIPETFEKKNNIYEIFQNISNNVIKALNQVERKEVKIQT